MTLTFSVIWIPVILTLTCLGFMLRPYQSFSAFDFGEVFRLFWLIPIGFIWAIYFAFV